MGKSNTFLQLMQTIDCLKSAFMGRAFILWIVIHESVDSRQVQASFAILDAFLSHHRDVTLLIKHCLEVHVAYCRNPDCISQLFSKMENKSDTLLNLIIISARQLLCSAEVRKERQMEPCNVWSLPSAM